MKSDVTLSIPKPCHENWKDFKSTERGGFCASCQKEVIDFTTWREEEIKQYFMRAAGSSCGKFRPNQLKKYHEPRSNVASRWAAILVFTSLWFARPAQADTKLRLINYEVIDQSTTRYAQADTLVTKLVIRGQVKDNEGQTMPGVNILRKGTTLGTVSDADGMFLLEIDKPRYSETIEFSFIGMVSKEVLVIANHPRKELAMIMEYDQTALNEIVVMGGVCTVGRFSPKQLWWKLKSVFAR
jgi:hypothetical protein